MPYMYDEYHQVPVFKDEKELGISRRVSFIPPELDNMDCKEENECIFPENMELIPIKEWT